LNITNGFKESPSSHAIKKLTEKFDAEAICLEQFPPKENNEFQMFKKAQMAISR